MKDLGAHATTWEAVALPRHEDAIWSRGEPLCLARLSFQSLWGAGLAQWRAVLSISGTGEVNDIPRKGQGLGGACTAEPNSFTSSEFSRVSPTAPQCLAPRKKRGGWAETLSLPRPTDLAGGECGPPLGWPLSRLWLFRHKLWERRKAPACFLGCSRGGQKGGGQDPSEAGQLEGTFQGNPHLGWAWARASLVIHCRCDGQQQMWVGPPSWEAGCNRRWGKGGGGWGLGLARAGRWEAAPRHYQAAPPESLLPGCNSMHSTLLSAATRLRGTASPGSLAQLSVSGGIAWARRPPAPWMGILLPQESLIFRCHLLGSSGFNGLKPEEAGIWDSGSNLDQLQPVYPPGTLGLALPGGSLKDVSVPGTDFPGPKWAGLDNV